jgi:hypothetical protein
MSEARKRATAHLRVDACTIAAPSWRVSASGKISLKRRPRHRGGGRQKSLTVGDRNMLSQNFYDFPDCLLRKPECDEGQCREDVEWNCSWAQGNRSEF